MTEKVYVDTNIFINHLFGHKSKDPLDKRNAILSREKLREIENGQYQGVISVLTIMEVYVVARRLVALNSANSHDLDEIDKIVKEKAMKAFYSINNLELIPNNDFDLPISTVLADGYRYIQKYNGRIWKQNGKLKHKAMNSPDSIHLSLAIRYNCDEFWTADKDFDRVVEPITVNNIIP
ncbi:MAG: hypothetical protein PWQ51_2046 [Methanolobus sp.]|jgi:predicted nucleic acid-binding protein|nr:hypothetical protein [Methanolobus sp.]